MKFEIGDHVRIVKGEYLAEGIIKHVSEYPPDIQLMSMVVRSIVRKMN